MENSNIKGPGSAEALGFNRFFRQAGWDRVTADKIVCHSPCYLLNVTLSSNSSGIATAVLYDGNSAGGRRMIDLTVNDDVLIPWSIFHPIFFAQGLFVETGSNVLSVFVHYLPVSG